MVRKEIGSGSRFSALSCELEDEAVDENIQMQIDSRNDGMLGREDGCVGMEMEFTGVAGPVSVCVGKEANRGCLGRVEDGLEKANKELQLVVGGKGAGAEQNAMVCEHSKLEGRAMIKVARRQRVAVSGVINKVYRLHSANHSVAVLGSEVESILSLRL